ncbi:hypothetical protein ASD24_26885 [Paenibacillus sp. Root52]|uniref:hypothetical protein n=1 Tax=Paenibacillus sp. Root52 TaxID=1736552 RepID=UPI0006FE1750|nr:hypothetical protein [Paenibacillus sp. Root52]KQY87103.1 hypothetical protein ASD24_26885 [Paenibacillus sp. Root52]
MKNRTKYILAIVTAIVVAAIAIPLYVKSQHTTFRAEVTDHMTMLDKIRLLEISKVERELYDSEEVQLEDPKQIQGILKLFKDVELQNVKQVGSDQDLPYYYQVRILVIKEDRFSEQLGISLYSDNTMAIYNSAATRDAHKSYKITNEFNFNEIERIFNKLKEEAA